MASSLVPVSPLCGHLLRRGVCVVSLLLPLSSVAATGMTARAAVAAAVAVGPEALTTAAVYARTRLHGAADVRDQHCCGQSKEGCVHVRRSAWNAGPTQEAGCSTQENQSSAQEGRRKTSERRQSTGEFFAGRLSLPAFRVHCSSSVERIRPARAGCRWPGGRRCGDEKAKNDSSSTSPYQKQTLHMEGRRSKQSQDNTAAVNAVE